MDLQPAAKRRLRQREEARRAILDATQSLLAEGGVEHFSMRRLADRCGYTAPTVYYYFGDKQGLLDALIEEHFATLLRRLRRVPASEDPLERLRRLVLAFVRFGLRNPEHYRVLMTPRREQDAPPPPSAEKSMALFEGPMEALREQGRLRVDDLEAARQVIWVTLHGLISLKSGRPDYDWARDLDTIAVEGVLRGLLLNSDENGASS
jgi:AcrR family transcriptional regulator